MATPSLDDQPLIKLEDTSVQETASPVESTTASPTPAPALSCQMCQNYETNLKSAQETERKLREELKAVRANAERFESDLTQEREYRHDLEKRMTEAAAESEERVNECERVMEALSAKLEEAIVSSGKARAETHKQLKQATLRIRHLEDTNEDLSKKLMKLLGYTRTSAAAMREEPIDMPGDVDQLQYTCLSLREQLIESRAAREFAESELRDERAVMREQLEEEKSTRLGREAELVGQLNELQTNLGIANSQVSTSAEIVARMEEQSRQINELQTTVAELEAQVQQKQVECNSLEQTASNYKARSATLQQDLDTMESVQKDFVKLSQNLQIQLEKIRQSDQEVRWQWEEEVEECSSPGCSTAVARLKPKPRCLHCGKIFCQPCVSSTVPSGRSRRPAPVCTVCHTLLNKTSAPFFSRDNS